MHPGLELLRDISVLFGIAILIAGALRRVRVPTVIGFLIAGIVAGPAVLNVIHAEHVAHIAEVGLVLLMFILGLELSLRTLMRTGWRAVGAGAIQIVLTTVVLALALWKGRDFPGGTATLIGLALTCGSTPIILKILADRGETASTAGRLLVTTAIIQDIVVVGFMMLIPLMAPVSPAGTHQGNVLLSVGGLVVATVVLWFVTRIVVEILAIRGGRELMVLFSLAAACTGGWLAGLAGWSPALGAFLMGLVLAESDVRHQLAAEVLPFREAFMALFFVSLGMLLNVPLALHHAAALIGLTVAALLVKALLGAAATLITGWTLRLAVIVSIGLSPMSEIGIVLIREGWRTGMIGSPTADFLNALIVTSMLLGTAWFAVAPRIASWIQDLRPDRTSNLPGSPGAGAARSADEPPICQNHVIIVGYGVNGQNVSRVLRATKIPYCVIEINRSLARRAREDGATYVIVADASQSWILEHACIHSARVLVVAINDPDSLRRTVVQAARMKPELYIIARTRYVDEIEALYRLGARMVIPEEFETSIEIFSHVLKQFAVPDNVIDAQIELIRAGSYGMLRGIPMRGSMYADAMRILGATGTQTFLLTPDSPAIGHSIRDLDLRAATGATAIALVREGRATAPPAPDLGLAAGDVLVLVGPHAGLERARVLLNPRPPPHEPPGETAV